MDDFAGDDETKAIITLVSVFAGICVLFVALWIIKYCHGRKHRQWAPQYGHEALRMLDAEPARPESAGPRQKQ